MRVNNEQHYLFLVEVEELMERPATLEKYTLRYLHPDIGNAFIVGVIIAKQSPKKLPEERAVWNFTLRDSPQDYINVACWGQKDAVILLNEKFQVGDVVEVVRPKIEIRRIDDYGEQFRPMVTSPFTLVLNEYSTILGHEGNDYSMFLKLLHYPTKPLARFITLADVHRKGASESGVNGLDILGAVKSVGNIRTIKTKDEREIQVREVMIFDHTNPELRFSIWNPDLMLRAGTWKPRNTILFMTDMRAQWSDFHRSVIASITNKTIITEDPVGAEANTLRRYALTAPLQTNDVLEELTYSIPNVENIQNVMNICQLKEKLRGAIPRSQTEIPALIYAFVSFMYLDDETAVINFKCGRCNKVVSKNANICENAECPVGTGQLNLEPSKAFYVSVGLSDHTGTLENCRLCGKFAEQTLGCDVKTFLRKTLKERTNLKWKFLMERLAVRLVVFPFMQQGKQIISIVNMSPVSPFDIAGKILHL